MVWLVMLVMDMSAVSSREHTCIQEYPAAIAPLKLSLRSKVVPIARENKAHCPVFGAQYRVSALVAWL